MNYLQNRVSGDAALPVEPAPPGCLDCGQGLGCWSGTWSCNGRCGSCAMKHWKQERHDRFAAMLQSVAEGRSAPPGHEHEAAKLTQISRPRGARPRSDTRRSERRCAADNHPTGRCEKSAFPRLAKVSRGPGESDGIPRRAHRTTHTKRESRF